MVYIPDDNVVQSITDDPFNTTGCRVLETLDDKTYNCAGFALSTYSWYLPCDSESYFSAMYALRRMVDLQEILDTCVSTILNELPDRVRLIESPDDNLLNQDEYMVAFSLGYDLFKLDKQPHNFSFHFRRKEAGTWFEKRGSKPLQYVLGDPLKDWDGAVFSPVLEPVYFACKYPTAEVKAHDKAKFKAYVKDSPIYEYLWEKAQEGYNLDEAIEMYYSTYVDKTYVPKHMQTETQNDLSKVKGF